MKLNDLNSEIATNIMCHCFNFWRNIIMGNSGFHESGDVKKDKIISALLNYEKEVPTEDQLNKLLDQIFLTISKQIYEINGEKSYIDVIFQCEYEPVDLFAEIIKETGMETYIPVKTLFAFKIDCDRGIVECRSKVGSEGQFDYPYKVSLKGETNDRYPNQI